MTENVRLIDLTKSDLINLIKDAVVSEFQKVVNLTTQPQKNETEILTREEVKDLLKISYTSLWKYNKQKTLVARKANGKVFYMRTDVMNLLNNAVGI